MGLHERLYHRIQTASNDTVVDAAEALTAAIDELRAVDRATIVVRDGRRHSV